MPQYTEHGIDKTIGTPIVYNLYPGYGVDEHRPHTVHQQEEGHADDRCERQRNS